MDGSAQRRGVLYPERLPAFHRVPAAPAVAHAVRWFWIPEWDLPAGESATQEILPFPACNLVVEPRGIVAAGPATARSERVLTGRGWAVGALLRPAAVPALAPRPSELRDTARPCDSAADLELHRAVLSAMEDRAATGETRRARAVERFSDWIAARVEPPPHGSDAELANRLVEALEDRAVTRVDQLPGRLHVSVRTLQRVAERFVGLTLHSMIRRRRLQEAAERLRDDPALSISALAGELGYADHAHFTSDFGAVLGLAPSVYRDRASGRSAR